MIGADLVRGTLIFGLLLVGRPDQVWIAYVVMALSVSASAFFEPARTATIPNITSDEELMPANALASATWSAMLALGASIGGLVTLVAGRNVAFIVNAISFFASAYFINKTRYDSAPPPAPRVAGWFALTGIPDLLEGLRYVRQHAHVAALMFVKAGWGLAGGVLLLLTIFGQRVFPIAGSTAAGIGVLYGARGIGAAVGPIALRWILGQTPQALRRTIGPAYFVVGFFYVLLALAPTLVLAALCVLFAHFGGAILWVFSTVLLQMEVPDRFRGRVFAAELALVTLTSSISSYWTGYELDRGGWSPRMMAFALGRDVLRARHALAHHRVAMEGSSVARCDRHTLAPPGRRKRSLGGSMIPRTRGNTTSELPRRRNSSIALCTSCFASSSCSRISAMSILGLPGNRSLRQYTPCWPTSASESVRRSSATARRPRALPIIVSWCSSVSRCLSKTDIWKVFSWDHGYR